MQNKLILGDNLEILKSIPSESIDLIYIDPPFFSNRNYEVIWGDKGEVRSFQDTWSGGMDQYIFWLKERVAEMYRTLKPTGSMYLHCDWHADAYIRVYIMDALFGQGNFRNEIVWCYSGGTDRKSSWQRKHDNIFFYTKSKSYTWNNFYIPFADATLKRFNKEDENGRYKINKLADGRITKTYMKEDGKMAPDWWTDINILVKSHNETIGYPTQKPEALLERIIKASSNEGDVVLDAFVGGGTTVAVADRLNRKWIGIDKNIQAIEVCKKRLNLT